MINTERIYMEQFSFN